MRQAPPIDERAAGLRVRRFRYAPDSLERVAYTGNLHGRTLLSPLAALAFPGFLLAFGVAVRQCDTPILARCDPRPLVDAGGMVRKPWPRYPT